MDKFGAHTSVEGQPHSTLSSINKHFVLKLKATRCNQVFINLLTLFDVNFEDIRIVNDLSIQVLSGYLCLEYIHKLLVFWL